MRRRRDRIRRLRRKRRMRIIKIAAVGGVAAAVITVVLCICLADKPAEEQAVWTQVQPRTPQIAKNTQEPQEELILVNWENPASRERPQDLVAQDKIFGAEVLLTNGSGSIDRETALAAREMFLAAQSEGIGRFIINNAYRSVIYQEKLWQTRLREDPYYGKRPFDEPVKVLPGNCSEHSTGQALDILAEDYPAADDGFGRTPEGLWLAENAWKYGFIQRYPEDKERITGVIYEPWHYRYVGRDHAERIYKEGVCLEEYLGKLPHKSEFAHALKGTQAVVIDAGHGQPDGGTTGVGGTIEEELNLEIAEKLKTELEHRGYLVAMTRTDHDQVAEDKDADMEERRRMLTDSGQDITISIHQNYYEADAEVSGPQVFHASGSVYGEKLAELIQRKLNEQLQPSSPREHTVGDFYIVRSGGAPCALVECGFLSNAEEEEKLADDSYQRRLVSAIADGIDAYF